MARSVLKISRFICILISPLVFVMGLFTNDISILNLGILLLWSNNMLYCLEDVNKRIYQLAFHISFFAFLLGRSVAEVITIRTSNHNFDISIQVHTCVCLYLSLLTLYVFCYIFEKYRFARRNVTNSEIDYESLDNRAFRKVSLIIFYSSYLFSIVSILEKVVYVRAAGYIAYYTNFTSRLPYIFTKIGDMIDIAFFAFLATMPTKKEVKLPIFLFLIEAIASLFTGRRGDFVIPLMIIAIYLFTRNIINRGENAWFTKRMVRIMIVVLPVLLIGLYSYSSIRVGSYSSQESFIDRITGFFNETGFSVNIINYEKQFENVLPHKLYSLGDTIDYLRENIVISKLFNIPVYRNNTVEKALNSYNFTQVITYYYGEKYYLSGHGLGSCYIAEAYHDFGYLGVFLWNIVYCYVLKRMYNFKGKKPIYVTLGLLSLRNILFAPRNMASAFLTEWISLDNWLVLGLIVVLTNLLVRRERQKHTASSNALRNI